MKSLSPNKLASASGGGAIQSVNTQTGAVSLGIEDLDDFGLNTVAPTSTWTNPNDGNPPANSYRFINNSGSARLSTTSSSGYEKDDLLARLTFGANVTITIDGVDYVGTVSSAAFLDDAGTSVEDVHVGFSLTPSPATTTLSDGPMTLSYDDISTADVPLADGDILQYNSTNSKFKPAQAAGVLSLLGIGEYADDTAAGTGGLSSGELYYNTTSSSYVLKT